VIAAGEAATDPDPRLSARALLAPLPVNLPSEDAFVYRGARALTILHERHLREFLALWREARASGVPLPDTSDEAYASYDALLRHVLRAAGRYLIWMCRNLELPDPAVHEVPPVETIASEAADYLDHVLERWREPLRHVQEALFEDRGHTSNWGAQLTIESMLEHAVMHPIRHTFHLQELLSRP